MKNGKTGISPNFFAVAAFILIFLNQILLCGLLLGFVIVVENDSWLNKQVIQAFCLGLLVNSLIGIITLFNIFSSIPLISWVTNAAAGSLIWIVNLIAFILIIIAIVRVKKGKDAAVPIVRKWAMWAQGIIEVRTYQQTGNEEEKDV